ncbi:MAG: hypothetical protein GY715_19580 [Planctomycetes bacterium]|nr:hypothetical protein [Planctomycetota bacterium]
MLAIDGPPAKATIIDEKRRRRGATHDTLGHTLTLDGIHAYALGTHTCNIGNDNLLWGNQHSGTPVVGFNAFRLENNRLVQVGMSWAKHGTGAAAGPGCGLPCNGQGGSVLGIGCRDVYGSGFNGLQSILGPRSDVNAWTGALLPAPGGSNTEITRRLQIKETDLDAAQHPDALYFVEGVYVALDDAGIFGNANNNASYRRVTVGGDFSLTTVDTTQVSTPAIFAWEDHGNGLNMPDPLVEVKTLQLGFEGRVFVAARAAEVGGGQWRYDYAIFNLSSDRSIGGFRVPVALGATVSDVGFHDVDYHSGELYDNTDWTTNVTPAAVEWTSPQSFDENPNSNAVRWGTMYNYWFTANASPDLGLAHLTPFKPGTPEVIAVSVRSPGVIIACAADLNDNGAVDFADILEIIAAWGPCTACAEDLDASGDVGFGDILQVIAAWGPCP